MNNISILDCLLINGTFQWVGEVKKDAFKSHNEKTISGQDVDRVLKFVKRLVIVARMSYNFSSGFGSSCANAMVKTTGVSESKLSQRYKPKY